MKIWIDKATILIFFLLPSLTNAQSGSYTDPGQAYNRLLLEKNTNTYYRIGAYKVIGSPYLFGEDEVGSIYSSLGILQNIKLRYNMFSQQLEASMDTVGTLIFKDVNNADSFALNPSKGHDDRMVFVNKKLVNAGLKGFLLDIYRGNKFSLYKAYKLDLAIVPTNYVQADLRQFELNYQYFYMDNKTQKLKKIRLNYGFISKEFKNGMEISSIISPEDFNRNPQAGLVRIMKYFN